MSDCDTQPTSSAATGPGCITCGDVGVEMRVVELRGALALCEAEGEAREVEIALLDEVGEGDRLLVHADVGLVKLGPVPADEVGWA